MAEPHRKVAEELASKLDAKTVKVEALKDPGML